MNKYTKSMLTAFICFILVLILGFLLPRVLPGDPVAYLSGCGEEGLTEEEYQAYYAALHLDKNIIVQFFYYIKDIFSGTLGYSYQMKDTVLSVINSHISLTLWIAVPALIISSLLGLFFGLYAGYKSGSRASLITSYFFVVLSVFPSFLIAVILVLVFGIKGNLPYSGIVSIGMEKGDKGYILDFISHLILPVLTLVLSITPSRFLLIRNMTVTEMKKKYVLYAQERGISPFKICLKYIFPNIAGPFIMMLGMSVSLILGGSVITETIFNINGMGGLLSSSIHTLDYPLIEGILTVTSFFMMISVVFCDILCILLDPKERRGRR